MDNDERNKLLDLLTFHSVSKQGLGKIVNELIESGMNLYDISAKVQIKVSILQEWLDSLERL